MSFAEDSIRDIARLRGEGELWEAGRVLGDLLEQLARDARCRDLKIGRQSRFAVTDSAAWAELALDLEGEGLYVRLEIGRRS